MGAPTEPSRDVEGTLLRVIIGYRLVSAAWLALLGVILLTDQDDPPQRSEPIVLIIGVVLVWSAIATVIAWRRSERLSAPWFVLIDAAVSIASVLTADWAGTYVFAGGYPLAAVFATLQSRGTFSGMMVAGGLSLAALIRLGTLTNVTSAQVSVVIVYLISGGVAAWIFEVIRAADRRRSEAERALIAERTERARAEERSELAARIHDSVLQTLALIQREGDDPRRVRQLARRQERELRQWLFGPSQTSDGSGLRDALTAVCTEIEELTGIRASLVVVGSAAPSPRIDALAMAAREAILNAAKHAGVDEISVYGEASEDAIRVFVRDRGRGFRPERVGSDRRGITDSIVARMDAVGGTAEIFTVPGRGTEIRLHLPWDVAEGTDGSEGPASRE
jgi:signal transduction histidine kinase